MTCMPENRQWPGAAQEEPGSAEGRIDSARSNAAERRSVGDAAVDGRSESERQKQGLAGAERRQTLSTMYPRPEEGSK